MDFSHALNVIQEGGAVHPPSSSDVWSWDSVDQTIVIQRDTGERQTIHQALYQDVNAVLLTVSQGDWQIVASEDTDNPEWWEEVDFHPVDPPALKRGQENEAVEHLQRELIRVGADIDVDGVFGPGTEKAVKAFQRQVGLVVDGIVGEKTLAALEGHAFPEALQQKDIDWAADQLGCEVAAIMAVSEVESRGRGFLSSGKPVILFERHWMYRRLKSRNINPVPHMERYPNIVNTSPGGYRGYEEEHDRLALAQGIDDTSALESASWGTYQIMGFHWESLGYKSVQAYVAAMGEGEREHLEAFVRFIRNDNTLLSAIRTRDWAKFSRRYNGKAYKRNKYDEKMAQAYTRYSNL